MSAFRELRSDELDRVAGGDGTQVFSSIDFSRLAVTTDPTPDPWIVARIGELIGSTDTSVGG